MNVTPVDLGEVASSEGPVALRMLAGKSGIYFVAGMAIDADGSPRAYHPDDIPGALDLLANASEDSKTFIQGELRNGHVGIGPNPGFFVSATALSSGNAWDTSSYVDAETVPYFVMPGKLPPAAPKVKLGAVATIVNLITGQQTGAIFADTNPHVGEASILCAARVGVANTSPKHGGDDRAHYLYLVFPNTHVAKPWAPADIKQTADAAFSAWGGMAQVRALFPDVRLKRSHHRSSPIRTTPSAPSV